MTITISLLINKFYLWLSCWVFSIKHRDIGTLYFIFEIFAVWDFVFLFEFYLVLISKLFFFYGLYDLLLNGIIVNNLKNIWK